MKRSIIQFFPSDITVIVRQCDRIGIYFQFRKQLRARQIREDTQIGNFESEDKFYTDSPFNSCLYLVIFVVDVIADYSLDVGV